MFPFDLQAKLAQTWFDAAAAGFAAMGSMATQGRNPWLAPQAAMPMASNFWGAPSFTANPWDWMTRPSTAWWQTPMPFHANWSGPLGFGMAATTWPSAYRAWMGLLQAPSAFSMFGASPWRPTVNMTWPQAPTVADTLALMGASYRTAGGHATAAIFRAMDPRAGQTRALPWMPVPFSSAAL